MDWINYKNQSPWDFQKQPNKWAYLNNKRWSDIPEAVTFSQDRGYKIDPEQHDPCGHWHIPEIIPPAIIPFPVGRLYGWTSDYSTPYAFGYDTDYRRIVKVDLEALEGRDYSVTIDPGWGPPTGIVSGMGQLIMDNCFQYLYMIFSLGSTMKIWKLDPDDLSIVEYAEMNNMGYDDVWNATADMQYIYMGNSTPSILVVSTNLGSPEDIPKVVTPTPQGADLTDCSVGSSPVGGLKSLQADPNYGILYYTGEFGTSWCYIKDFEQVGHHYLSNNDLGIFTRNSWMGPIIFNPLTGAGTTIIGYHPMNPRYTSWNRGFGVNDYSGGETDIHDAASWDGDWCDTAYILSGWNFYPAFNTDHYRHTWVQNLGTLQYYQDWRDDFNDNKLALDLFETHSIRNNNIACNKKGGTVILKAVQSYPDETIATTFLTRVEVSGMTSDVFRKALVGYQITVPVSTSDLEPQIWRY
jgi:hypothetical protein